MPKGKNKEILQEEIDRFRKRLDLVLFGFSHNFPFWAVLSERCRYSLTRSSCPTACVDKNGHILFNYDFVETLSNEQLLFLVAHEICHFIFEHSQRLGSRDHRLWNIAADYAINLMLHYQFKNSKFKISDIVFDESWNSRNENEHKYGGMSVESIYEDLKNDSNNKWCKAIGNSNSIEDIIVEIIDSMEGEELSGGGGVDNQKNFNGKDYHEIRGRRVPLPSKKNKAGEKADQEMRDYVRRALTEAFTLAKSQGSMPGEFERAIQKLLRPRIDWISALRQKLRMGVSRTEKKDVTWSVPNRRFLDMDFVFPSSIGPESPKIVYAIDTSGSMSEEDITRAVSELEDIRKKFNAKIYFLDCDAEIHSGRWIEPRENLPKLSGGGGTDFRPVFDHLNQKKIKPDYCIFFTDGYGDFGEDSQKHLNVLWILTSDVKPPFGDTIRYNVMQEN